MNNFNDTHNSQTQTNAKAARVTIVTAEDKVKNHQYLDSDRGSMDDRRPTFYGMAGSGEIVTLFAGMVVLGSVQANANGEWSLEINQDLSIGRNSVVAKTATSESANFVVNVITEATPVTLEVRDAVSGELLDNNSSLTALPKLSGTAEPHATVHVAINTGKETMHARAVADENGNWTYSPDTLPIDRILNTPLDISVTSGDASAPAFNFVVTPTIGSSSSVVPPKAPAVSFALDLLYQQEVTNGGTVKNTPVFSGTAEPFAEIKLIFSPPGVYPIGLILDTVYANANGEWHSRASLPRSYTNRELEIHAKSNDQTSEPFLIKIDQKYDYNAAPVEPAEPAPIIIPEPAVSKLVIPEPKIVPVYVDRAYDNVGAHDSMMEGLGRTDDATPTFSGRAGADQLVTLYSGDKVLGSVVANGNGNWSLEIPVPLTDGAHRIIAKTSDSVSPPFRIYVELPEQINLSIISVVDNVGGQQWLMNGIGNTDDANPTFSGRAAAGQTVTLYSGDKVLGSAIADGAGNWSVEIPMALENGRHAVIAKTATQQVGPFNIFVQVAEPEVPVTITSALDNVGAPQWLTNGVGSTDDTRPTFSGRAAAWQTVTLYSGDKVLGSVTANGSGVWSLEIPVALENGRHSVIAKTATQQSEAFNISVQAAVPEVPVSIISVMDNVGEIKLLVSGVGSTDDTNPTFAGRAGAWQIVTLYSGDKVLGSATANGSGIWTLEIPVALESGRHSVIAKTATQQSGAFNVYVQTAADMPVLIHSVLDNVGATQWLMNGVGSTDDTNPTFSGRAGALQIVTLYSGDKVLGSVTADGNGIWSLEIPVALESGRHSVIAKTATQQSAAFSINVQTPADVPVTIASVLDNVGAAQWLINGSGSTDDRSPTFSGRAGAWQIVTLYSGDKVLGSVTADGNGNWSLEIPVALESGRHDVIAKTATQQSGAFSLRVHTPADEPVTIGAVLDNVNQQQWLVNGVGSTDDANPTFYGRAGALQIVTLYSGDKVLGSTIASSTGNWILEIPVALEGGHQSVVAKTSTQQSAAFDIHYQSAADVPVTITSVLDNVGESKWLVSGVGNTDDANPTFAGRAGAWQIVTLYSGDKVLGSVTANGTGAWSLEIPVALESGRHSVIAKTATQQSGEFNIDLQTPADAPLTIDSALDNVNGFSWLQNGVGKTDDANPSFSGRAGSNQIVTLYSGDTVLGSIKANAFGNWVLEIPVKLTDGLHNIIAKTATQQSNSFAVTVEAEPGTPVTILYANDDVAQYATVRSGGKTDDAKPTFYGTAKASELVTLYSGEKVLGSIKADAFGNWRLEVELEFGANTIVAKTAAKQSNDFIIELDIPENTPVRIDIALDDSGSSPILIDRNTPTADAHPTFQGIAGPGEIVTLYSGTQVLGSTQAGENGGWSLEITNALENGDHQIIATTPTQQSEAFVMSVQLPAWMSFSGNLLVEELPEFFAEAEAMAFGEVLELEISELDMAEILDNSYAMSVDVKPSTATLLDENTWENV